MKNGFAAVAACGWLLFAAAAMCADAQDFLLLSLRVEGNRVTRESYIRSRIPLREGARYGLEEILRGINETKENLMRTGLFSSVMVNDQTGGDDSLVLVVRVKERGYVHAGPSGFVRLQGGEIESRSGLSASYDNLFGNGTRLALDVPVYEAAGFGVTLEGRGERISLGVSTLYEYDVSESRGRFFAAPFASTRVGKASSVGFEARANIDDLTSAVFTPSLRWGSRERPSEKSRRWMYADVSPYAGINIAGGNASLPDDREKTSLYGVSAEMIFFRDLLLTIVSATSFEVHAQGGTVPENLRLTSPVRGNRYRTLEADVVISSANELRVPLPWSAGFVLVPFFDAALMGNRTLSLYAGGGIGFRWHKGLLDPLLIDLAFGRGITLNFEKRL